MNIDNLLIGAFLSIGTALASLIDKWKNKENKNYKKSNFIAVLLFLFGALGIYMTYNSAVQSRNQKIESDTLAASRQRQYEQANAEVIRLQSELYKSVYGSGDCVFGIEGGSTGADFYPTLKNLNDKYSAYVTSVMISDYDKLKDCKTRLDNDSFLIGSDCYFKSTAVIPQLELIAGAKTYLAYKVTIPTSGQLKKFEAKITTRNGFYVQQSIVLLQKGVCPQFYKLFKEINGKYTVIKSENNIPGLNIDWDKVFYPVTNRFLDYTM